MVTYWCFVLQTLLIADLHNIQLALPFFLPFCVVSAALRLVTGVLHCSLSLVTGVVHRF